MSSQFNIKKGQNINLENGSSGHDIEQTTLLIAEKDFNLKEEIDTILAEQPNADMWMIEHKLINKGFLKSDDRECTTFFLGYSKVLSDTKHLEICE